MPGAKLWFPGFLLAALLVAGLLGTAGCREAGPPGSQDDLHRIAFDGGRGQVEVGGPFVGAAFHHSRPLPSRLSFYYPVANSLDLSTDYWQRDVSAPMRVTVSVAGRTDTLGLVPAPYAWSPHAVRFTQTAADYTATFDYAFGEEAPFLAWTLTLTNTATNSATFEVATALDAVLRTSHAYTWKTPAETRALPEDGTFLAAFPDAEADSALVFVMNAGAAPADVSTIDAKDGGFPGARFFYTRTLAPGERLSVVQLVGTLRLGEEPRLANLRRSWHADVAAYDRRVARAAGDGFEGLDPALAETERFSKALLEANRHFLDAQLVPMPCPAEYNFFFTHDLLLTDLGAVRFDAERVRADLVYLRALAGDGPVLPHAYYWREGAYRTEWAGSDNWNHLWFILLSGAYLKHTGDTTTVDGLYPMLRHSLSLLLENERGGLMYGQRPDWWDIGDVYGARAYLTSLTARALRTYAYLTLRLGRDASALLGHLALADRLQAGLVEHLWDDEAGYLLNDLDTTETDRHYYAGSLVAAAYGLLDAERTDRLLGTARRELLDEALGIRIAMPADFHELEARYRFNGPEAGAPYVYLNGGVWPHGTAWYILALSAAGRPDEAASALRAYLTLEGVRESPNGQPAFYEYRRADAASPDYGAVDKPTFLWAGGWYLHALYQLAGVRENPWNLSFSADLPAGFDAVSYPLVAENGTATVSWSGRGRAFREIRVDGEPVHSAVLTGPARRIELTRGAAETPYLAAASALVEAVDYDTGTGALTTRLRGVPGQTAVLEVAGPTGAAAVSADGGEAAFTVARTPDAVLSRAEVVLAAPETTVRWLF